MSQNRKSITESVKRTLRQESGFGCCICGSPIMQFHHIVPWSEREHFDIEDMMALCPSCHDACGEQGSYSRDQQYAYKKSPYNIQQGTVSGLLSVERGSIISGGGNFFLKGFELVVDDELLFAICIESGHVFVSGHIFAKDGTLLAKIEKNEWTAFVPEVWDIESKYRYLRVRNEKRGVLFAVDARNDLMLLLNGRLYKSGHVIVFNRDRFGIENATGGDVGFQGCSMSHYEKIVMSTKTGEQNIAEQ